MTLLFYIIYLSLAVFLSITLVNIVTGPFLRKEFPLSDEPLVSILIPARNEAHNIQECLRGLISQNYRRLEIIVLDDHSEDHTAKVVEKMARKDPRIRLYQGQALPSGWTGKNWACQQLGIIAHGEILIFTDADNRYSPRAIGNTLGWMQRYKPGILSAFPQQLTGTPMEKLVLPVIDLFLYSSLTLWLIFRTAFSSLAAANGQWIAFQREAYRTIGGHYSVRSQIVEDVELSRLAKKKKISILTVAGTGIVFGKMYHSAREVWDGFSKNLFGLVSNRSLPFLAIMGGLFIVYILPFLLIFLPGIFYLALGAVALNMLLRLFLAVTYKHPILISTLLHPLSILLTIMIGINSFYRITFRTISWKEREINVKGESLRG